MNHENARRILFPYGMEKDDEGRWVFFNRNYKHLGSKTNDWADWDNPDYKLKLKGLGGATLKKLDVEGVGTGNRIYFYDDSCIPALSKKATDAYLAKLSILLRLEE